MRTFLKKAKQFFAESTKVAVGVVIGISLVFAGSVYAAVVFDVPADEEAGKIISAESWNKILGSIKFVGQKTEPITNVAGRVVLSGKGSSVSTVAGDADDTLATKDYVDAASGGIGAVRGVSSVRGTSTNGNSVCANLVEDGHEDWRLPTIEEITYATGEFNLTDNFSLLTRSIAYGTTYETSQTWNAGQPTEWTVVTPHYPKDFIIYRPSNNSWDTGRFENLFSTWTPASSISAIRCVR